MQKLDNILFWKLILACHRTRALGRACAQVGVSLSVASKLIAAFEAETKVTLLDRSSRPVRMTDEMERLLPVATQMVKAHAEAERAVLALQARSAGMQVQAARIVRICLPINVRNDRVLSKLLAYAKEKPWLRLEFLGDEGFQRLMTGRAEIAQFGFHPKVPELHADYIRTNVFLMLASHAFVRRYGLPKRVEDLEHFPVVIRNPENRSFSRHLQKGDESFYIPDGQNIIYADTTTARALLVNGEAIAIDVSISTVLPELEAGRLVPVLPGWHRRPNDTYVCCHEKNATDPVIHDLMTIIRETLRDETQDRWETWFERLGIDVAAIKATL